MTQRRSFDELLDELKGIVRQLDECGDPAEQEHAARLLAYGRIGHGSLVLLSGVMQRPNLSRTFHATCDAMRDMSAGEMPQVLTEAGTRARRIVELMAEDQERQSRGTDSSGFHRCYVEMPGL